MLIDLTVEEPARQAEDFLRKTAREWGVAGAVCEEMAETGLDLVRCLLAYSASHRGYGGEASPIATLRVRGTSPGIAVVEIWDARIPVAPLQRRANGQRYRPPRLHRPLYRFYRVARLRIGRRGRPSAAR
ncbi:hypothetical protein [Nocardia takedensis]|uniref:hypothetical protein n=1 Tax=Nocardia takedensis TaxID=259390 RepID=UPI0005948301|nr:hypothetical protein [Nocardia takedensis]